MDTATRAEYRRIRSEVPRIPAVAAYRWAQSIVTPDTSGLEWSEGRGHVTLQGEGTVDGFDVVATVTPDDDLDLSWAGYFTDGRTNDYGRDTPPAEGAVDARHVHFWSQGQARWFVPETTEEQHYAALVATYGKTAAREAARDAVQQTMRLAARPEAYVLSVTVSREGVTLGEASLHGFDVDSSARHAVNHAMIVNAFADHDLVGEALAGARETLARLVATA